MNIISKLTCITLPILLLSCEFKLKPNSLQLEQTYSKIDCYKKLNGLLRKDSLLKNVEDEAKELAAKGAGLLAKDARYRLISRKKILSFIGPMEWYECDQDLKSQGDFIGLRCIEKQLIIFEISINQRLTLFNQSSKLNTYEVTRLIYNPKHSKKINWKKCSYGEEVELMKDKLDEDWMLLITKFDTFNTLRLGR